MQLHLIHSSPHPLELPGAERVDPHDPRRGSDISGGVIAPSQRPSVLVVDDLRASRELIAACIAGIEVDVREAADADEALSAIRVRQPDLIVIDVELQQTDGIALCRTLKANAARALTPVVLVDPFERRSSRLRAIAAGADEYIAKPFDPKEFALVCSSLLERRLRDRRLDSTESVAIALLRIAALRDPVALSHGNRVGDLARSLGGASGITTQVDREALFWGGLLHDVGKASVPDQLLTKSSSLTPLEWGKMREHSVYGERICQPLQSVGPYVPIVKHHHERWDGTGYPDGLAGEDIPLAARIVAVVDAWDAMTTSRPYREGLPIWEAARRLRAGAGTQWDPSLVEAFLAMPAASEDGLRSPAPA